MHILHLWVREGKPYLLHLVFAEKAVNNLNTRAQKSNVLQSFFQCLLGTSVYSRPFDVNSDEVDVRINTCQSYGILTLSTAQFKHNGVIIVEILLSPVTFHVERCVADHAEWVLKDVLKRLHFRKFL